MFRMLPWALPVIAFVASGVVFFIYDVLRRVLRYVGYGGFSGMWRNLSWIVSRAFERRIYPGEGMSMKTVGPIAFCVAAMISTIWIAYLREQDRKEGTELRAKISPP